MAVNMGTAIGYLDLDTSKYESSMKKAQTSAGDMEGKFKTLGTSVTNVGDKMTAVGGSLTKSITLPLAAVSTAAVKLSTAFETNMAKIKTIADTSKVSMQDLGDGLLDLSNDFGLSAEDMSNAMYDAISSGVKTGDALKFISDASKLAISGFSTTGTAVDILTTIMNAYGMSADQVTHISDVLVTTQNLGKTTVDELASSMGKVIPTANSYGVSLENLGSMYTILTSKGIATAEATTYINSMMNELADTGSITGKMIDKLYGKSFSQLVKSGVSVGDILAKIGDAAQQSGTDFMNLWGSAEAGKAAASIVSSGAESYNKILQEMQTTTGDVEDAFATMSDTTEFKFNQVLQTGKNLLIKFGDAIKEAVIPMLEKGSAMLQQFYTYFTSLSDEGKRHILVISAIAAAIGPILMILGNVVSVIGKLLPVIGAITGPMVAVAAVIGVLIAAFVDLWKNNEEFRNNIISTFNTIKSTVDNLGKGIVDRLNSMGGDFTSMTDVLKAAWDGFTSILAPVFEGAFKVIGETVQLASDLILGIFDIIKGTVTGDWSTTWEGIKTIFVGVWDYIVGYLTTISDTITSIINVFLEPFGVTIPNNFTVMKDKVTSVFNSLIDFFRGVPSAISGIFDSVITFFTVTVPDTFNSFVTTAQTIFNNLPYYIGYALGVAISNVIQFGADLMKFALVDIPNAVDEIQAWFDALPGKIATAFATILADIAVWGTNLFIKGSAAAIGFFNSINDTVSTIPGKVSAYINELPGKVGAAAADLATAGANIMNSLWDGLKGVWKDISDWFGGIVDAVKSFVSGIVDGMTAANNARNSASTAATGSNADGLAYVPYNGYTAKLHEGETVLTKNEATAYRNSATGGSTFIFNSPKSIDEYEAAKQFKRTIKELSEVF